MGAPETGGRMVTPEREAGVAGDAPAAARTRPAGRTGLAGEGAVLGRSIPNEAVMTVAFGFGESGPAGAPNAVPGRSVPNEMAGTTRVGSWGGDSASEGAGSTKAGPVWGAIAAGRVGEPGLRRYRGLATLWLREHVGWAVFGILWVSGLAMALLHVLGAFQLNPLTTTVSDYVSLPGGAFLLAVSVLGLALATVAVPARVRWPFWLGAAGLVATVVFPTNAVGTAPDVATVAHRYAAALFFICLPIGAWLSGNRILATVSAAVGILFLVSHLPLVLPHAPGAHLIATVLPRGAVERVLLGTDIVLLARRAVR